MKHSTIFNNSTDTKKGGEETLSEIQDKYRKLVENLPIGVYRNTPGPKGHFLEANSAIIAMFEAKSKEEFMKHNVSDLYQNPEKRKEFVAEMMKYGEVKNKVLNLVTLKGKKIVAAVTAAMKKDTNGNVYFDGIIMDITKQKMMETELMNYRDTLEIEVKRRTTELQEANKKLYGEITQRKKTQNTLLGINKELEVTKKAMLNVMEDLEKSKEIIELEKVKDEAMIASIGEGLVAVDNNRKVMIMNETAQNMLGWKIKEMIGHEITNLPLEDDAGNLIPLDKRPTTIALATGEKTKVTYFFVRKDKTRFPIAITATPIKLRGKTIGLIEIIRDITRELEIDREKSEFVSLASHQLRTPLGIIKWYIEALESENYIKKAPEAIRKYFSEINKSNERVLSLVRNLLSVSRIEQGRVKNVPKSVNLINVVNEIVEQMQIVAHKKRISLHLTIHDHKIPSINIDILRLQEVIENLIANAVMYTLATGRVDVSVNRVDDTLVISVKDTGIGIPYYDLKRLFTKFYRSAKAIGHNPEGSGLGLYVVKSYVEGWGGKISAKSVEGKGSTFTISLPISNKKNPPAGGGGV